MEEHGIVCEFSDPDFVVLMLAIDVGANESAQLEAILRSIPKREPIVSAAARLSRAKAVYPIRDAMLAPCETLPIAECLGRVLAAPNVACPPAVPVVMCGEEIDADAIEVFSYYRIKSCCVMKK